MAEKLNSTKDFQEVVDEYLAERRVFKPGEVFVKELSLCPRYIGGPDRSAKLLDAMLKMVNLVKEKRAVLRNQKSHDQWLKSAAQAMETYCVANRDWISEHVWKLKARPVVVSHDYDPERGRKDIRYMKPTSEAPSEDKCLEKEEGEESMGEISLDLEEDLLYLLDTPKSKTSGGRQEASNMEVDPEATVKLAPSPRRSPRLNKGKVKISPIKTPLDEPTKSKKTAAEVSTIAGKKAQATGLYKRKTHGDSRQRRHSTDPRTSRNEKAPSAATVAETTGKTPDSRVPLDASSSKKERKHETALPASSVPELKRTVTVEKGKSVQAPQPKVGKRSATELPPITISVPVLKKTKTDDLLRQVRKTVDEGRKTRERRKFECWIPGCLEPSTYPKVHAFEHHIPEVFDERLKPDDERVLRSRRNALNQAARWLLGRPATLDELVSFVVIQKVLSAADNTRISEVQKEAMKHMCTFLRVHVPDQFTLEPANSPAVLIHWRAVLLIAATLQEDERRYWQDNYPAPEGVEKVQRVEPEVKLPEAFDSHFHLDRTLRKLHLSDGTLEDIFNKVSVDNDKRVKLVGTVAVYCDPASYPSERTLSSLPEDMSVAIGFHPKHASSSHRRLNEDIKNMLRLLRHPKVSAFGEIGIDHTEPRKDWSYQVDLLEKILPELQDQHVLIVHCRGMRGGLRNRSFSTSTALFEEVSPHQSSHSSPLLRR
ncbi:uncharacterized protein LOC123533598 [Mercenaria mercenaria]|uniref:uncharacterized protein LOC123533598 n=1 Tax=Mercenaria mercenaria TaxID=6596 RepID=UPI00234EF301|nr:uncharacterized protein LOC123533598 [Mercenaria mercenaria]